MPAGLITFSRSPRHFKRGDNRESFVNKESRRLVGLVDRYRLMLHQSNVERVEISASKQNRCPCGEGNVRKVDELPWQFLQAANWEKSEQLLTDLAFLEAKAEAGMVPDHSVLDRVLPQPSD